MLETKQISLSIIGNSELSIDANYTIQKGKVHIYTKTGNTNVPWKFAAYAIEMGTKKEMYFEDCNLIGFSEEYEEYIAHKVYINESRNSFKLNSYKSSHFVLSQEILRFLNPPFTTKHFNASNEKVIIFDSSEQLIDKIPISEEITLVINRGFTQSYSRMRYAIQASSAFYLFYKNVVTRETIQNDIEKVANYFSLYSEAFLRISAIKLQSQYDKTYCQYFGPLTEEIDDSDSSANFILGLEEIDNYSHKFLIKWMSIYPKLNICIGLMRDAQKINDETLKFICYTRALEVLHKELFIEENNVSESYFDNLLEFITVEKLITNISTNLSNNRKNVFLIHRFFDLVRFVYPIISDPNLRLVFGYITNPDNILRYSNTRNYLIHFSSEQKEISWDLDSLPHVNKSLKMLLKVILLKQIGLSEKAIIRIANIFKNNT